MSEAGPSRAPEVPNYLIPAILSTLLCCPPFGIVAIVFAAQVNSKLQIGDVAGALAASRNAKRWSWISAILGLILTVLSVILSAVFVYIAIQQQQQAPLNGPVQIRVR